MTLLDLNAAKTIKSDLMLRLIRPRQGGIAGPARFQTLEDSPKEILPLAVGISRAEPRGGYAVAIRVQAGSEQARREGARLQAKAESGGATVDLAEVEDAVIPGHGRGDLASGHPVLTGRAEALCVGLSIGHADGGIGSLGCFVERDGAPALVSCSHVLADSGLINREVVWIHHPGGRPDTEALGGHTRIARLGRDFVEFSTADTNSIDAALAALCQPDGPYDNRIPVGLKSPYDGQRLAGVLPFDEIEPHLGARVGKVGRTTGYTEGTLTGVLDLVRVLNPRAGGVVRFVNVLEVTWDDEKPFTQRGDSGATVFLCDNLRVVGLHFASPSKRSFACSLEHVMNVFNASWL